MTNKNNKVHKKVNGAPTALNINLKSHEEVSEATTAANNEGNTASATFNAA